MNVFSFEFVAGMAGTLAVYWLAPSRWRLPLLSILTLGVLCYLDYLSAILLLGILTVCWAAGRLARRSNASLLVGGLLIVAVLVSYKLRADRALGGEFIEQVAVPLGLSYYALRAIHYLFEIYSGRTAEHSSATLAGYLLFLPTLLAGPIHRFAPYDRDLARLRWDSRRTAEGCERILYGYVKISVLGNALVSHHLARLIEKSFAADTAIFHYLDAIRYGLNLYFQFAGYSDVAIGFALLLGFRVMENFNNPFFQANISLFWRSWHISLSSWFREYVYVPIVAFTRNRVLAILIAMILLGLWHEVSVRFLVWGAYHGLGIVVWHGVQQIKARAGLSAPAPLAWAWHAVSVFITVNFVMLSFVFTKERSLEDAFQVWRILATRVF